MDVSRDLSMQSCYGSSNGWRMKAMPDVRLIDADALCRKISESIRQANEWENEAREKKDTHGVKYAIDTRRSLLSMLSRVQEEPTIDAQPVKQGKWITTQKTIDDGFTTCSYCHREFYIDDLVHVGNEDGFCEFCPSCGSDNRGDANGNQV
jgi:hypothetical protein